MLVKMGAIHKIYARLRNVPARGLTTLTLKADGDSSIILASGDGYPPGVSLSSPLPNVQIGLLRFSVGRNEIQFLSSNVLTLVDLYFYVWTELPSLGGDAMLPAGADLQISTAWDCMDIIGNSSWFVAVAPSPEPSAGRQPAPSAQPNSPGVPQPHAPGAPRPRP
jgi:hypothetical protein